MLTMLQRGELSVSERENHMYNMEAKSKRISFFAASTMKEIVCDAKHDHHHSAAVKNKEREEKNCE